MRAAVSRVGRWVGRENLGWIGLVLGALYWVIESFVDVFAFGKGDLLARLVSPDPNEAWMRLIIIVILGGFGLYARSLLMKRRQAEQALVEEERRFRDLYEEAPIAYFTVSVDGLILMANRSAAHMLGYQEEELVDRPVFDLYADGASGKVKAQAAFAGFQAGDPIEGEELQMIRRDGTPVWISLTAHQARNAAGEITHSRSMAVDVTERKRAEEALRESREWLSTTLHSIGDGVIATDVMGHVIFVNPVAETLTGWPEQEAIGLSVDGIFDISNEYTGAKVESPIGRVIRGGVVVGLANTTVLTSRDGTGRPIFDSGAPIKDADGATTGAVLVFHDATESRQALRELRTSEEFLTNLMRTLPDMVLAVRMLEGRIEYASPGAESITGYLPSELIGQSNRMLIADDAGFDAFERRLEVALAPGDSQFRTELELRRKDGEPFWCEVHATVIAEGGRPVRVIAAIRDITDRRELQEQLLQSQKMEAVGQLAGGVAHDFNNLLTAILGYAHMATNSLTPGHVARGHASEILSAAQRASSLTRQLLMFSRRHETDPTNVDLNGLIVNIARMIRRLIGETIELVTVPASEPCIVLVDPGLIEQVLVNLAVNARDAMPDGGRLDVETSLVQLDTEAVRRFTDLSPGAYVRLIVRDSGTGMDEQTMSHVFEPFFTTKPAAEGTGLGLSICFGIVRQAGGDIRVQSSVGQGTTFEIFLPRISNAAGDAVESIDANEAPPTGTETILLVEDEDLVRRLAAEALREQGYEILEASNGEEALAIIEDRGSDNIDLLLTDVIMPRIGGIELADMVGRSNPNLRILFMTGYSDAFIITPGETQSDARDLIQKPFSPTELARRIREVLDAP